MDRVTGRTTSLIEQILFADRVWGVLRLVLVLFAILLLAFGGAFFVEMPLFNIPAARLFVQLFRYAIIPVTVVVNVLLLGALYIQDIYELDEYKDALRFLTAALFSIRYPSITVEDGRATVLAGQTNLLESIGGPGWLKVMPGNAVLLESLRQPTRVLGDGYYFIPRFEKINRIIDLRDQEGMISNTEATTKDGIVVKVGNIRFRYRIDTGSPENRSTKRSYKNPYPFSEDAILKYAYTRSVGKKGMTDWPRTIKLAIDGAITGYIGKHNLDTIMVPSELGSDPRDAIKKQLNSEGVHARLKGTGTQLLWVDIGYLEVEDPNVNRKYREVWEAKWSGRAAILRAQGEAEIIAIQEQGRAEGQASLLTSIANSLRDAGIQETDENLWNIVLARTAQILEATTSIYQHEGKASTEQEDKDER